ncbi:triacylglycerol lipase OBL1-like [Benincasa hispida]|uniref:triacylglycerol lipase OBL1-like n=1 Tax=Benincasa hispida TaxID=102211 RepID=UPI0018FFE9D0|nr:triacylglycerol lipase OBL1-like [Benincasa hispida]
MGSNEIEFRENYLILKAKDAKVRDVFLFLLPSGSRKIKNVIYCPDDQIGFYTNFKARWTISVSILAQKFLLTLATLLTLLAAFWSIIQRFFYKYILLAEFWVAPQTINFMDLKPKVRCRDWKILDPNDNADMNLEERDFRYYSNLTIMASKLAYQDYSQYPSVVESVVNDCWQMNLIDCFNFWNDFQDKATTHAFMFENTSKDPKVTVVAFRGTSVLEPSDWTVDFNFSWSKLEGVGNIHAGFMQALGFQDLAGWPKDLLQPKHQYAYYTLRQKLKDIAKANDNAEFIITGHSLGGALATLFVTLLAHHNETTILHKIRAVYTYGQPRVGNQEFAQFMVDTVERYGFKYYRYVYSFDLVPRVPFDSVVFKYKHFGGCVYFDCFYHGKFLKEQPNTNYFSPIWLIPKYLSACWEFIRSLIITPIVKGRDYFEGFFTILERTLGLLIPGISAHVCSNYVNVTRLGNIQLPSDYEETLQLAHYIDANY